jgi:RHS repeat-associated protein
MKMRTHVAVAALLNRRTIFSILLLASMQTWVARAADTVYIKGSFDVNRLGSASYNIPVEIPPGTAGMQPSLSLTYNSGLTNGLLGKGWSLGGLSVISRCGATIAQDGYKSAVNLSTVTSSSGDRFCLDGQKLIAKSGTYGAAGTEYRTELESYSRIYSNGTAGGGPASFTVYTKAGQTLQYGTTTDSEVLAQTNPNAVVWALHSVTDLNGNYYQISYYNNAPTGQFYPTEIDYTGNTAASLTAYNKVMFVYTPQTGPSARPDQIPIYPSDALVENYVRMTDIETYAQGNLVLDYHLQYQLSGETGNSLLTSVQEIGADGVTQLAPTTFGWNGPSGTYATSEGLPANTLSNSQTLPANYVGGQSAGNSGSGIYLATQYLSGDFDGNGVMGFAQPELGGNSIAICTSTYHGQAVNCTNYSVGLTFSLGGSFLVGDFDGDGKMDVAQVNNSLGTMIVCYSNGGGSFSCVTKTMPAISGGSYAAGDFDGDGRTDIFEIGTGTSSNVEICLSQGRSTDNNCVSETISEIAGYTANNLQIVDLDGDGKADVFWSNGLGNIGYNVCYSNLMPGTDVPFTFTCPLGGVVFDNADSLSNMFIGDFNGDGSMDVAQADFTTQKVEVCYSIGRGITPNCVTNSVTNLFNISSSWIVADFNGDGKADILTESGSASVICYSAGNGQFNCTAAPLPAPGLSPTYLAGDFTGDGVASVMTIDPAGTNVSLLSTPPIYPDLMTTVTNGLGATTQITYNPLTNGSIYTKGSAAIYPTQDTQSAIYVVSSVQESNGIGGTHTINYSYGQAQQDLQGRGFLGFGTVQQQDLSANQTFETTYNQVFPLTGLASNTYKWVNNSSSGASILVGQNSYGYGYTNFGTGAPGASWVFPFKEQEVDKFFDPSAGFPTSAMTTLSEYDAYGNVDTVTVATNDGYTRARTNTFNNFTGAGGSSAIWYLGQPTSIVQTNTNPSGASLTRTTQYTYSNSSLPNEVTQEKLEPSGSSTLTKAYTYDGFGNQASTSVTGTGLSARNATIVYDSLGQFPITITNAYSQTETQTHDPRFGTLASLTDPNLLITRWTYDLFGRKVNEARPDSTSTSVVFSSVCSGTCSAAYSMQVTKTGSPQVTTYYDILDREIQSSTIGFGSNLVLRYKTYDGVGRPKTVSRNMFSGGTLYLTTFGYDNSNRVISELDPDGSSKSWYFNGLSVAVTNNNGQTRIETKDSLGQTQQVTDADGHSTYYAYDPFGNLTATTDPNGHQIVVSYDVMGRKTGMIDPDMGTWSYTYNGAGEMLTQTDTKHQTTTTTYDNLGRMISRVTPEFTSTWTYDTATNGIGKLAAETNGPNYSKSYGYDSYGRPSAETTTLDTTYTIGTTYDSASRISQITYPTGFAVKYTYDTNGYLTELDNASTSAMYWKMTNANADTQPLQESLGNGLTSSKSYYGPTGLLNTTVVAPSSGSDVQNLTLSYDHLGNLIGRSDLISSTNGASLAETYTYDKLNRITGSVNPVSRESFSYDATGNLISKTNVGSYTYGTGASGSPLHAVMLTNGPTSYTFAYDADGNMTSGAGRTLTWNSFNKVASIQNANNTVHFSYDADFERYKETETTCTDYLGHTSSTCTKYMINPRPDIGVHFEKEINGSITSYRHFLLAGAGNVIGVYTSRSDGSTSTEYFHKDHLGSVMASTDEFGNVTERLSYDAFGKRRNPIGTDDPNDLLKSAVSHQGFTGQEHLDDGGIGLIDLNGRVYDPFLGRFTSADPTVQAPKNLQSLNRYSYVLNNPTSGIDPSGYISISWSGFVNDVEAVGNWIGGAVSAAGNWIANNAETIGIVAAIIVVSAVTYGAADAALLPSLGGLGAAVVAGAAAGAVAGALSSTLMGGGFSWQAVGMGALTGAIGGGFGYQLGTTGTIISSGVSNWLQNAAQGHAGFHSFAQGLELGAIIAVAQIGLGYLTAPGEDEAVDSGADQDGGGPSRSPASVGDGSPDTGMPTAQPGTYPIDQDFYDFSVTMAQGNYSNLGSDQLNVSIQALPAPPDPGWCATFMCVINNAPIPASGPAYPVVNYGIPLLEQLFQ